MEPMKVILAVLGAVGLTALFVLICVSLTDNWGMPLQRATGHVATKEHESTWTQLMPTGKTVLPIVHPDTWRLDIVFRGLSRGVLVSEEFYNGVQPGDQVLVVYQEGRFLGRVHIVRVHKFE